MQNGTAGACGYRARGCVYRMQGLPHTAASPPAPASWHGSLCGPPEPACLGPFLCAHASLDVQESWLLRVPAFTLSPYFPAAPGPAMHCAAGLLSLYVAVCALAVCLCQVTCIGEHIFPAPVDASTLKSVEMRILPRVPVCLHACAHFPKRDRSTPLTDFHSSRGTVTVS